MFDLIWFLSDWGTCSSAKMISRHSRREVLTGHWFVLSTVPHCHLQAPFNDVYCECLYEFGIYTLYFDSKLSMYNLGFQHSG